MNTEHTQLLFALLRAGLFGDPLTEDQKAACTPETLQALLRICRIHDIAHILGQGLYTSGMSSLPGAQEFQKLQFDSVFRYERSQHALNQIAKLLTQAQIPFIPLKGAVLRQFYPEPWMRTSCDLDVLVHPEDLDRAVEALEKGRWERRGNKEYHDISLNSPAGIHLELHFSIREDMEKLDTVLDRVWEYARPEEAGAYAYRQSGAFLMFHLFAHMAYHFSGGGCGIRYFTDIWLLENKLDYDRQELEELCREAGLCTFKTSVFELLEVWFANAPHSDKTRSMEEYIVRGGSFGTRAGQVTMHQAKAGGKASNLRNRIFMPYDKLKIRYPKLEGKKWLTPAYQVVRWCSLFADGRLKRSAQELQLNQNTTKDQVTQAQELLKAVGLDL